ncbi:hypothetical protein LCGC14_0830500 [marine sediment metagenome]|uniref:Uncharacterized protein n=1 Tax=marine sediment metagenome TaxID=412755 RepID=A0A0F9PG49_9ZZZZ|nr:MAG: hypothetical protein Lokiarch_31150 [Candidatus Lokiarchaeum sp. GC14_75]
MVKKNKYKNKDLWTVTKKKYRLTTRQIEMAKKLGMNPKKFGKYSSNNNQPWKEPLGSFIERCYEKRFNSGI